jgi:hypothetical protein
LIATWRAAVPTPSIIDADGEGSFIEFRDLAEAALAARALRAVELHRGGLAQGANELRGEIERILDSEPR